MRRIVSVLIITFVSLCIIANITIFKVSQLNDMLQTGNRETCTLKYTYVTGAGWTVIDSTQEWLIGENVIVKSWFDPRLLHENSDFKMDYMAQLSVSFDKVETENMDNENVYVIIAKDVTILYDTDSKNYKVKDMLFAGLLKCVLGLFDKKFRYSY